MATITKLPIDFKGTLASNLRIGEEHTLTKANGRVNRMLTPDFGAFYTESLEVRTAGGALLKRDVDYVVTYFYKDLGDVTAKEICAIIVITNTTVGATVRIKYQAVGGPYALSLKELKAILDETEAAPGKIKWEDIIDKPLGYAPDQDHTHEYWQLYGLESTNINLTLLGEAWAKGRKGIISDNRIYYQNAVLLAQAALDSYRAQVNAHLVDTQNPHQTDKVKIQLGNIQNWPLATVAQSTDRALNSVYQPIGGIFNQLEAYAQPVLNGHINDKGNPHNVTLDHPLVNLYSTQQINDIFAQRLARTQVAVDSAKFAGLTAQEVYDNVRRGLDTSNVDINTKFRQDQIAVIPAGIDPTKYALSGAQTVVLFEDSLKEYNNTAGSIWFVGSLGGQGYQNAINAINAFNVANNLSIGTWVIGQWSYDFNDRRPSPQLIVAEKTASGMVVRI